jgi:hypothetical protein
MAHWATGNSEAIVVGRERHRVHARGRTDGEQHDRRAR